MTKAEHSAESDRVEAERWRTNFKEERRLRKRYEAELRKVHAEGRWHCETCACDLEDPTQIDGGEVCS